MDKQNKEGLSCKYVGSNKLEVYLTFLERRFLQHLFSILRAALAGAFMEKWSFCFSIFDWH